MTKQTTTTTTRAPLYRSTILALAVAGVLGVAQLAGAQQRVDRSGANDANNRIGSNGRNGGGPVTPAPWQLSNAIVYGNVTGGKQFRGGLATSDAREFRGGTANRQADRFVRDSAGVSTNGVTSFNANQTRAYYGDSRGVAPPPGFTGLNSLGGYTAPRTTPWRNIDPRQQAVSSGSMTTVVRPDQFGAPGAMDLQYAAGAVMISPYDRAQGINPSLLSDYTQLNRTTASPLNTVDVANLREQSPLSPVTGQRGGGAAGPNGGPVQPGGNRPGAINDAIQSGTVQNGGVSDAVRPGTLNNGLPQAPTAEPGMRSKVVGAAEPSSTYSDLAARRTQLDQSKRPGQSNEDAARSFNDQMRARDKATKDAANKDQPKPGTTPPGAGIAPTVPGTGDLMVKPGDLAPRADDLRPKPADLLNPANIGENPGEAATKSGNAGEPIAPLKVGTLAGSTTSKGLNDLLTAAEQQMREGKFATAIESYDAAETIAPGDPLVKLGRAHAELGGAYYRRAETSLRKTLQSDKNLLAGQYDLRAFLGEQRLQHIDKDLNELMQKNPNDVGAALLLSYVYYNTGDERRAAAQLDLADKRAGGNDAFIKLLRDNWSLPKPGANDNK